MPDFEHVDAQETAFTITDDSLAQWAMRRHNHYLQRITAHDDLAASEIARVEAWRDEVNAPLRQHLAYFQSLLEQWARQVRETDPAIKTVHLPAGELSTRKVKGRIDIADDAELITWASANLPGVVVTKQTVSKSALGKLTRDGDRLITEDGEIVPSVTVGADSVRVQIVPVYGEDI
jgi:hypothetical protein